MKNLKIHPPSNFYAETDVKPSLTRASLEGGTLRSPVGAVSTLTSNNIGSLLTANNFDAYTAVAFTSGDNSGATFIAMNDGIAGFQAGSDAIIRLSNYIIGANNPVTVI